MTPVPVLQRYVFPLEMCASEHISLVIIIMFPLRVMCSKNVLRSCKVATNIFFLNNVNNTFAFVVVFIASADYLMMEGDDKLHGL